MRYRYRKSKKHEMMLKVSLKKEGETGLVWEEGCCGGHLAAALKSPLILAMTDREKAATKYISSKKIADGFVLGGSGLISDDAVRRIFDLKVSDRIKIY